MLGWAATFFIIAIVAGVFGFGGISEAAADVGIVLFVIAVVAFVVTLFMGLFVGKKAVDKLK